MKNNSLVQLNAIKGLTQEIVDTIHESIIQCYDEDEINNIIALIERNQKIINLIQTNESFSADDKREMMCDFLSRDISYEDDDEIEEEMKHAIKLRQLENQINSFAHLSSEQKDNLSKRIQFAKDEINITKIITDVA